MNELLTSTEVTLKPDPSRTIVRPFAPEYPGAFGDPARPRAQVIVDRILAMDEAAVAEERRNVVQSLDERHRDVDDMLLRRFHEVEALDVACDGVRTDQAMLIGAYFCEEYSYEAAALFNPSIVLHPDQKDAPAGAVKFVMSLRAIGEGHVSSVTFRAGLWDADDRVTVKDPRPISVAPIIDQRDVEQDQTTLRWPNDVGSATPVLFPLTPSQRQGIEDMRLVRFEDEGKTQYFGTYTAFNGLEARSELLETDDFLTFNLRPMTGNAAAAKGMALFPRKVGGRYAMLSRQDSENIWLMMSDDIRHWEGGHKLIEPRYPWEFVQMGNCGSPIEIDEGWLVLTHGVGTVRNYCMGAALLDKDDPSKVLARTPRPIVEPSPGERDGYVPNVVYSCGSLANGRRLLLPYGVADYFTTLATLSIDDLLAAMV
ncbi:glycoside hydrolase family 130 protein [Sphingomonas bacterium]|uniref:glycoside hydrolase family 130 protein n=1 Tax=Sphingomonas bacterium TaxID=1895847 RepID=UPI001576F667|nr:glycoside hydrolase family 130 protein [Sphingomonas bacterium]